MPTRTTGSLVSCTSQLGEYHVSDIEFVAAFDVDAKKVGQDLVARDHVQREQHDQDRRRPADRT